LKEDYIEDVKNPVDPIFIEDDPNRGLSQSTVLKKQKDAPKKNVGDKKFHLPTMKTLIITLYPNLQKPNIDKI